MKKVLLTWKEDYWKGRLFKKFVKKKKLWVFPQLKIKINKRLRLIKGFEGGVKEKIFFVGEAPSKKGNRPPDNNLLKLYSELGRNNLQNAHITDFIKIPRAKNIKVTDKKWKQGLITLVNECEELQPIMLVGMGNKAFRWLKRAQRIEFSKKGIFQIEEKNIKQIQHYSAGNYGHKYSKFCSQLKNRATKYRILKRKIK